MATEVDGGGFHGQGEPAEEPHDRARFPVLGLRGKAAIGLVAAQEGQRVLLRQFIHGDEALVLRGAGDLRGREPGGGDEVQMPVAGKAVEVFRLEQFRVADVIEDQQAALALGEFPQHAVELQGKILFLLLGELKAHRPRQPREGEPQIAGVLAGHLPASPG